MANFTALAAARHAVLRRAGWDVERDGLQGAPRVRVFAGEQSHATVYLALRYLGLGAPTAIAVDRRGADAPERAGRALADGDGPAIVCAQAGNVNTGAFDPFDEIADSCATHGAWLHVDGAFGLWAAASPSLRHLVARRRAGRLVGDRLPQVAERAVRLRRRRSSATPRRTRAAMTWQTSYVDARRGPRAVPVRARGVAPRARVRRSGRRSRSSGADGRRGPRRPLLRATRARFAERCRAETGRRDPQRRGAEPGGRAVRRLRRGDARRGRGACRPTAPAGSAAPHWHGRDAVRFSTTNWSTTADDIDRSAAAVVAAYRGSLAATTGGRPRKVKCGDPCLSRVHGPPLSPPTGRVTSLPSEPRAHPSQQGRLARPGRLSRGSML